MAKRKWGKPMLTVLTRGDRGERVLNGCKMATEEEVVDMVTGYGYNCIDGGPGPEMCENPCCDSAVT